MNRKMNLLRSAVIRGFEGESAPEPTISPNPPAPAQTPPANTVPIEKTPEFNNLLNRKIAEEKKKIEDKNRQTVSELTALRESANLTEQQKQQLQTKIEELESTYRTAEEEKKLALDQWEKKYNKDIKIATEKANDWENKHNRLLISVDINRAAQKLKAFDADQIEAILNPLTKVVEKDGKLVSQVKFTSKNKDGQPIVLDLSVEDAVKAMHEWPEKYGNLFESTAKGGLGSTTTGGSNGNGRIPDVETMDHSQYKQNREKILAQMRASST